MTEHYPVFPTFGQVIRKTTTHLALLSIAYYALRFMVVSKHSFFSFSFLFTDLGYVFIMIAQVMFILSGVKSYGNDNPSFSLGKGIKIGCYSAALSKFISLPTIILMGQYIFPNSDAAMNTIGILSFPFVVLFAGVSGAVVGFLSGLLVR